MKTTQRIEELERCHTVTIDDVTLKVIAQLVEDNEWELCIENAHGIKSIWTEWFNSGDDAIRAGIEAIEKEGGREFASADGFEYLLDK